MVKLGPALAPAPSALTSWSLKGNEILVKLLCGFLSTRSHLKTVDIQFTTKTQLLSLPCLHPLTQKAAASKAFDLVSSTTCRPLGSAHLAGVCFSSSSLLLPRLLISSVLPLHSTSLSCPMGICQLLNLLSFISSCPLQTY